MIELFPLPNTDGVIFEDVVSLGYNKEGKEIIVKNKYHNETPEHVRWGQLDYLINKAKKEWGIE